MKSTRRWRRKKLGIQKPRRNIQIEDGKCFRSPEGILVGYQEDENNKADNIRRNKPLTMRRKEERAGRKEGKKIEKIEKIKEESSERLKANLICLVGEAKGTSKNRQKEQRRLEKHRQKRLRLSKVQNFSRLLIEVWNCFFPPRVARGWFFFLLRWKLPRQIRKQHRNHL